MKWFCKYWPHVGLGVSAVAGILLAIFWNDMTVLARIHTLNFIVLGIHQFEEYVCPGGMGVVMNKMQSELTFSPLYRKDAPIDRYPLNQMNSMAGNCFAFYLVYLLPILFPNVIWLGMGPILFGMGFQVLMHCIFGNIKLGCFYNPGMAAVLVGHVPLGIWFFVHLAQNGLLIKTNIISGVLYLIAFAVVFMFLTYKVLASLNDKWAYSEEEMAIGKEYAKKHFKNIHFED